MTERRRYLTTPIYYASGPPHLGHAYTTILGDVLARFYRQDGEDVLFLTGTDEFGQKIYELARDQGIEAIELVNRNAAAFQAAWEELHISHDRFIRTTEEEHVRVVTDVLRRMWDLGLVYDAVYDGWYCVTDERYWTDKDVGEAHRCPVCTRPVTRVQEKNYFYRMSAFQERLVRHIEDHPDWIVPDVRRNEVLGFLQQPLQDLSISRPRSRVPWGIPMPWDDEHVCYVWVDALYNYVTASGALTPGGGPDQPGFTDTSGSRWPCDLHLVGKDIITTHAVYWPTLLMGVGLPLPRQILAHGWWVVGETKMSKSLGNVVDPLALRKDFGTDAVRWYLLREMSTGGDASYTPERFLVRYEELANVLGNLASRVISMVDKYRGGVVPDGAATGLAGEIEAAIGTAREAMGRLRVHEALAAAMDLARAANGYVESRQPWAQVKEDVPDALDETLASLMRALAVLCALFEPVTPAKMIELAAGLGLSGVPTLAEAPDLSVAGLRVRRGAPLFPRVESPSPSAA